MAAQPPETTAVHAAVLLIDFNNLLVRAWHAGKPSESHAVRSMFQTVAAAVRSLRPSGMVFCLDGGHSHRAKLLPTYKAHRPPSDPDLVRQRQLALDALELSGLQVMRAEGFEADDVIATLATREPHTVILSSDKDLLSLCGVSRVYHPWNEGAWKTPEDVLGVSAGQVTDYLALCGDASDGIPGVKGIGEKTALKLISEHGCLESVLAKARVQHIPGAVGRNLRDGAQDALLSQQLVQLVTTLPLPPLMPWTPREAWQAKLTALRLGAVAAILDSLTPLREPTALAAGPSSSSSSSAAAAAASVPSPTFTGEKVADRPDEGAFLQRSITEPIRPPMSVPELWQGPDRGLIGCWERGRLHNGRQNPWRSGTANHTAWQQGQRGEDLHIAWSSVLSGSVERPSAALTATATAAAKPPAGVPATSVTRRRSLFDDDMEAA